MDMPLVVDSHCHLDFEGLRERLPEVLARARDHGVRLVVTIGTRVRQFAATRMLAEAHDEVWCTVGTHPHNAAEEADVALDDYVSLASHPKVVAIGEAGLDYHYDFAPRDVQQAVFRTQVAAARLTGLPLVVHSRDAEEDTIAVLESEREQGAYTPLLHCYSSRPILAERGLAIGAYVSFSGMITFKGADEIREVARRVPLDRLLVETDAPYLAPVPYRGKPNEPAHVVHTLERLALVKGVSVEEMARQTSENFFRLFGKVKRPPAYEEGS
jgi:TatD DNase family protein